MRGSASLIPIITSKLPYEIRIDIARKATGDVWRIYDLLDTIKVEIEAREVSDGVQSNPLQRGKAGGTPTVGAFVWKDNNSDNFHIHWVYCEDPHYSASCKKVVGSEARKVILRDTNAVSMDTVEKFVKLQSFVVIARETPSIHLFKKSTNHKG